MGSLSPRGRDAHALFPVRAAKVPLHAARIRARTTSDRSRKLEAAPFQKRTLNLVLGSAPGSTARFEAGPGLDNGGRLGFSFHKAWQRPSLPIWYSGTPLRTQGGYHDPSSIDGNVAADRR
jgi:hypothetical protein